MKRGCARVTVDASDSGQENPVDRLTELRTKYREYHDWQPQRFWTRDFVARNVDLENFRKDSAFVYQEQEGKTEAGYFAYYSYLKKRDHLDLWQDT